jgi:hypothetical protein
MCQPFNQDAPYAARVVNALAAAGIPAVILAHQGGWDEMLLVVGPIALVAGLLWLARRRVMKSEPDTHPSVEGAKSRPPTLE